MPNITIRPFLPGEASYISWLHMKLYKKQYGFHGIFEYYVMKGLSEFLHNPAGGQLWVALDGDVIVGSIAVVRVDNNTAQLRWFVLHEDYQGKGIGRKLMETAMGFVRGNAYQQVYLWTIQKLDVARHLYEQYGFIKRLEEPNTEWTDEELIEERWDLSL